MKVRTDDDLALAAVKTKLSALALRPGYRDAMSPKPKPGSSRTERAINLVLAAAFLALAIVTFQNVAAAWLSWLLLIVFIIVSLFFAFGAYGSSPAPTPRAIPVVITAKLQGNTLKLLGEEGIDLRVWSTEDLYARVRVGDVGVAHVEPNSTAKMLEEAEFNELAKREWLVAFHRL